MAEYKENSRTRKRKEGHGKGQDDTKISHLLSSYDEYRNKLSRIYRDALILHGR